MLLNLNFDYFAVHYMISGGWGYFMLELVARLREVTFLLNGKQIRFPCVSLEWQAYTFPMCFIGVGPVTPCSCASGLQGQYDEMFRFILLPMYTFTAL